MSNDVKDFVVGTIIFFMVVGIIVGIILALMFGIPAYNRSQAKSNAKNNVQVTHIKIKNADEEAQINHAQIKAQEAEAEKRIVEAKGISKAQEIINNGLTPLYVQHEAIAAQKAIATSGRNNTVIYVPAGTNGTPVITQSAKP